MVAVKFQLEQPVKMADVVKLMNHLQAIALNVCIIQVYQSFMKVSNSGHAAQNVQQTLLLS